jgi:hypothetical protein
LPKGYCLFAQGVLPVCPRGTACLPKGYCLFPKGYSGSPKGVPQLPRGLRSGPKGYRGFAFRALTLDPIRPRTCPHRLRTSPKPPPRSPRPVLAVPPIHPGTFLDHRPLFSASVPALDRHPAHSSPSCPAARPKAVPQYDRWMAVLARMGPAEARMGASGSTERCRASGQGDRSVSGACRESVRAGSARGRVARRPCCRL